MTEKKSPSPPAERTRDEVYGMRTEDVIEAAKPKPAEPVPPPEPAVEYGSIEEQMGAVGARGRPRPRKTDGGRTGGKR